MNTHPQHNTVSPVVSWPTSIVLNRVIFGFQFSRRVCWKSHGNQAQIATLLGVVIAEGFIAMEAEDSTEVERARPQRP